MLSQIHTFCMDMTALERQQARFKWLLQQENNFVNQYNSVESCSMPPAQFHGFFDHESMNEDIIDGKKKPEMYPRNNDLPKYGGFSLNGTEVVSINKMDFGKADVAAGSVEIDRCLSRTSSCQIGVVEAAKMEEKVVSVKVAGEDLTLMENKQSNNGCTDHSNKRKAEFVAAEGSDNKTKEAKVDSEVKEKSSLEISADSSKENQKTSALPKTDYIHVRARRGHATDSHSLAERARREKISKKMRSLQDLVPGCDKITGRAGVLDEIINYVQSLQRQVEFLSMKLTALNPRPEFNIENFSGKEFPAHVASFPAASMSSTVANLPHIQLNLVQPQATCSEQKASTNPPQFVPEKTTSSSAFILDLCLDPLAVIASTLGDFNHLLLSWHYTMPMILTYNKSIAASSTFLGC